MAWAARQGASQVAWHVAPCWGVDTAGGGGECRSNYIRSAEALSKAGERKQRRSPTALSPHCQETKLGLDRWGEGSWGRVEAEGGGGQGEKREGDQNPAGVLRQHVVCQCGSVPLQHRNTQWISSKVTVMLNYLSPCRARLLIHSA